MTETQIKTPPTDPKAILIDRIAATGMPKIVAEKLESELTAAQRTALNDAIAADALSAKAEAAGQPFQTGTFFAALQSIHGEVATARAARQEKAFKENKQPSGQSDKKEPDNKS